MINYKEASHQAGQSFFNKFNKKGKITMLNLIRFKNLADYSGHDEIKPEGAVSGKEAYGLYLKNIKPLLEKAGSKILFVGDSGDFLIGPEKEKWDMVLLVEHESVSKLIEFSQQKDFLKFGGHRTAAVEDSRLLPISENEI